MTQRQALPRRRTVLAASTAAVAALAAAGCSVPDPRRTGPRADPAPGMPIAHGGRARLLQIVAHPDDDLYFMNPDARRMLTAGVPVVCVYVTAGEHRGVNRVPGRPGATPPADKAAYSSARHQGLRQAYAELLGLPRFTPWNKGVTDLRGGHRAELNTLAHDGRSVELVFLNLAMHTTRDRQGPPTLWSARELHLRQVVSADSPLTDARSSYDYDGLVDVLAGLLDRYRPTVVHTLDPDPDIQLSDEATRRRDSEQRGYSDHGDHTAVASFSWAALIRWVAESTRDGGAVPAFAATAFRGYYNRHWPKNLPPAVLAEKASHLVPYGGDPDWDCGNPSGCGDYSVGGKAPLTNKKGWVRATHHRYPGARLALADEGGRTVAYGVLGLRAVRWAEASPGVWGAPRDLGGGPLAPVLGSAATRDGRRLLFGLRFAALAGHDGANRREVVLLEQGSPGGPFRAWQGLGNPERQPDRGRRIGVPVAVTAPDGRVHLFVRNADRGLSGRVRETDGTWGDWRDLGGAGIQDGLSAVVDGEGLVHVFGAGLRTVHHWAQARPGAAVEFRPGGRLPVPGDAPAGLATADGSVEVLYRSPAKAGLKDLRPDGTPGSGLELRGYGPVAAARGARGPVLLGLDEQGAVQLLEQGRRRVRTAPLPTLDGPALFLGADGRPVAAGLGPDAAPWSWR
ncbi:PIG-L family deacetylase [Streptomyces sp. NPDC050504]|uniref:PIG-L family deacetylase n=1 Tax=Streptomyces sp. NPDC050504 TaxID=3365618 RepID=UPI00379F7401